MDGRLAQLGIVEGLSSIFGSWDCETARERPGNIGGRTPVDVLD